jgi:hypothetical protein
VSSRSISTLCLVLFLAGASIGSSACAKPEAPTVASVEPKPAPEKLPQGVPEPLKPEDLASLPPPVLSEIEDAVKRVFDNSAVFPDKDNPTFLISDFNGDVSPDLAVILKPVEGELAQMNREFPKWILKDPLTALVPTPIVVSNSGLGAGQRIRVERGDVLLAVIHGHGPKGWRDPEATQTYLLKNVVGNGMNAQSQKEVRKANKGQDIPQLTGDVIAQTLGGQPGFLYYTGAAYAWYDRKRYKAEEQLRLVHAGNARMAPPEK